MTLPEDPTHRSPSLVEGENAPAAEAVPTPLRRPPLDRELREAVRARDREALAAFYERYFDEVYGWAYRLVGTREVAEDLAQEVFIKVHQAAHRLDPARDPLPWLAAIVWNACRDHWRSGAQRMLRRSTDVTAPAIASALPAGSEDPAEGFVQAERERIVQDALGELPEGLRVVVVLYDFAGFDLHEVAHALGVSHAAARKRHSRALDRLGELLRGRLER